MVSSLDSIPEPLARLSRRMALFSLSLVLLALLLHRFVLMSTPTAINLALAALALAALAVFIGLLASISIWTRGRTGAGAAAVGMVLGGLLWLWPLAYASTYLSLPRINDITTDAANPPRFTILSRVRGDGANPAAYPGERFARQQTQAYPDLRTLVVDRAVDEVFDLIVTTVRGRRGLGWKVLLEEQPTLRPPKPGVVEATDRTMIVGFVDDIAIRVSGTESQSRIDIRSASRFGGHDFGANASRIRRFVRELQSRLESTTPGAIAGRGGLRAARAGPGEVKRPRDRLLEKAGSRSSRDPAPRDAPRAPTQKGAPRG
jgi:hypothetical protein